MNNNKRANNFSRIEVDKLLELVEKYKNAIGNKKTDRASTEYKNEGWKKVEKEFNTTFKQNMRSDKVLRTKYENLKRKAKQSLASVRIGLSDAYMSQVDEKILAICSSVQMNDDTKLPDLSPRINIEKYFEDTTAPMRVFEVGNSRSSKRKVDLDSEDAADETENGIDCSASGTDNEADIASESFAKLQDPSFKSETDNIGHETEDDTISWSHWRSPLKKSDCNNPLRILKKRTLVSQKKKWTKNAWAMIAKKELDKIDEEMAQQRELHKLELKKMEQALVEQSELHQLAVKKLEQELEQQRERHQREMKKMDPFLT